MSAPPPDLDAAIESAMLFDQPVLRRRLSRLRTGLATDRRDAQLADLAARIQRSVARREQRLAALPIPRFPPELPISRRRDEIAETIANHQVTIVCGETGSGKTTQLPKICLQLGRGAAALIGHTQPRRIAARSVAARIAEELRTPLGALVGYKIRFKDRVSPDTCIKLMTDGVLLAEIHDDRELRRYDTLIVDEAHERSLNIDFLLGYLKRVLPARPELKLVMTSATINPEHFSRHFDGAPIVNVSGRTFPVRVDYRPPSDEERADGDFQSAVIDTVRQLQGGDKGDILVFLPGERDIRETARRLRKLHLPGCDVLSLYGRLGSGDQDRVFKPAGGQKVVLATNIAETSLTVPNIGYVIDTGVARISRYSFRSKLQRLPIEAISQASAEQRKGRCGRTGPGLCIRLYSEDDFQARAEFTEPEIQRTNLAAVCLRMKHLELGDIEDFPFLDQPDRRFVSDGMRLLAELGAIDDRQLLTQTGRRLAKLPVDPRIGRMILAAGTEGSLREVLIIAGALSIQDPFERPQAQTQQAVETRTRFLDKRSDFMAYLGFWRHFHRQAKHASSSALRRLCKTHDVSWTRMGEWREIVSQLNQIARESGLTLEDGPAGYVPIHRALLAGSLGTLGMRSDSPEYLGARGTRFRVSPASVLKGASARWLIAAELIETRRVYAHRAARVQPQWVEQCAPAHLLRRSHVEPYFDPRNGQVMCYERVTLYGLPVIDRRRCRYERWNPLDARAIFIASALVEDRLRSDAEFLRHNAALIESLHALEHRLRRTDIVADDATLAEFFDRRLPPEVCSQASFERWRKRAESDDPRVLHLDIEQARRADAPAVRTDHYPDAIEVAGHRFPLRYRFDPGHDFDGVTATVPAALINQLPFEPFEWLVEGLLPEKITALLRTLPKSLRRHFVPIPRIADACLSALTPGEGCLTEQIAGALHALTGVSVPPDAWKPAKLASHLHMNLELVDGSLATVGHGRDLLRLRERYGQRGERGFDRLRTRHYDREGLTDWSFETLPDAVDFTRGSMRIQGFPALVDDTTSVSLRLVDTPGKATRETRRGLRRLLLLRFARDIKSLRRHLPDIQTLRLLYATVDPPDGAVALAGGGEGGVDLVEDIIEAALGECFLASADSVRSRHAYAHWTHHGAERLTASATQLCALLSSALGTHHALRLQRRRLTQAAHAESLADIDSQLRHLVYRGFVTAVPTGRLAHYPRYLQAVQKRLEKLESKPLKDARRMRTVQRLWQRYLSAVNEGATHALDEVRWMIEELRVATFAQDLGTDGAVSCRRIESAWPGGS